MDTNLKTKFIPGLELNRLFFNDVIQPLLESKYPNLAYSAGLIGYGSDTLGVDTHISMDHNWGPRCILFLRDKDMGMAEGIKTYLANNLPFEYKGFPTNYSDPAFDFTQHMKLTNEYPIRHMVEVYELEGYFKWALKIEDLNDINPKEWLSFNDQELLELTTGEVFHDGLNKLNKIRETFSFYPDDVLKLRLASLWASIGNEEPFIGRSIDLNDFVGIKIVSTRILNSLMKIIFYLERKYIPYGKWFGILFNKTGLGAAMLGDINNLLTENEPEMIQEKLCLLYEKVISFQNQDETFPQVDNKVQYFFDRPYKVVFAERIAEELIESIKSLDTKGLDLNRVGMDIKMDSVDITEKYEL